MTANQLNFLTVPQRLGGANAALKEMLWQLVCDFRTALPCVVKSFDAVNQRVTVQPAILDKMNVTKNGVSVATDKQLPLLLDVPISLPRSGGLTLTLPIQPGDECLVIFADMNIASWKTNGGENNSQESKRRHDLSDGVAVFTWSAPRKLTNYSTTAAELRTEDGTAVVSVGASQITINAPKVVVSGAAEVDITSPGVVKIQSRDFLLHTHSGVQPGGGVSGPVV